MRRYNRRLYRIARDFLHSDTEAETSCGTPTSALTNTSSSSL